MVSQKTAQLLTFSSLVFAALMIFVSQWQSDLDLNGFRTQISQNNQTLNIITAENVKKINMGFNHTSADYLWLKTIQHFGGGNPNQTYLSLFDLIDNTVKLDPQFEYPYLFGGVVLPWQGQPKQALDLLDRGAKQFPENGLFPYNAGTVARLNLHDSSLAAAYFKQAIGKENTPPAATLLAGVNLGDLSDREIAITWFNSILQTETNPSIIERAEVWRDHLILLSDLENTIHQARNNGHQINQLSDLVSLGYLKSIPLSPLGVKLKYNKTTGLVEIVR